MQLTVSAVGMVITESNDLHTWLAVEVLYNMRYKYNSSY